MPDRVDQAGCAKLGCSGKANTCRFRSIIITIGMAECAADHHDWNGHRGQGHLDLPICPTTLLIQLQPNATRHVSRAATGNVLNVFRDIPALDELGQTAVAALGQEFDPVIIVSRRSLAFITATDQNEVEFIEATAV